MKKSNLLLGLLVGLFVLAMTACSSNDDAKDDEILQMFWEPGPDLPLLKTVNNHPGIICYDSELEMWYIDYLRNRPAGSKERHYIEDSFQEEGQTVLFSGNAYYFPLNKAEVTTGEYDYLFIPQNIIRCNHLQSISDVSQDIAQFLDTATATEDFMHCQFDFPESTLENNYVDTCYVFNDQAQLASFYTGEMTIPAIDFTKYTLVIGRAYLPDTGYSMVYHDVSADAKAVNLYVEKRPSGFCMIRFDYYWGLYPKFEGEKLVSKKIENLMFEESE